jgi:hypothetical protein
LRACHHSTLKDTKASFEHIHSLEKVFLILYSRT